MQEVKTISAYEARQIVEKAQKENFQKAMQQITIAAENGQEEVFLFGIFLSMEDVKKLIDLGYTVTHAQLPLEVRKVWKVTF